MSWLDQTFTMIVGHKEKEGNRVYLFKKEIENSGAKRLLGSFTVSVPEHVAEDIEIGDTIEYESLGVNSGYFVRRV